MPKDRTPDNIFVALQQNSQRFKTAATQISDNVKRVEKRLNELEATEEAFAYGPHPSGEPGRCLGLRIVRDDGRWRLFYGEGIFQGEEGQVSTWRSLSSAPLDVKIVYLQLVPVLLRELEATQLNRIVELENAQRDFDKIADAIGLNDKEGA